MTRPLALLRPEPGWSASAARARDLGMAIIGHPLFEAEPVSWELPEGGFDALLAGSATVFAHGGSNLDRFRHLPVHAVGKATADAANSAGFSVSKVGEGGLQALLDGAAGETRHYLRLGGAERVSLTAHPGQRLTEVAVYRMRPIPLVPDFARLLASGPAVVGLHSAAAARHFVCEVERLHIPRTTLTVLALGQRIAQAAGGGWASVEIADRPNEAALLAKAAALCKEGPQGRATAAKAANGSQNGSG